jgi:SAM-dependent methyltransferase
LNDLPFSPAAERNRQPILEKLRELLPQQGTALEIAAGTGQHAAHFAAGLPGWTWQPTDHDAAMLPAIAARTCGAGLSNVREPLRLDVLLPVWPADGRGFDAPFDAIFCANMLHISPWATCAALMQGAARHLKPSGMFITYGPYLEDGVVTSEGNLRFDESLRSTQPDWGLRHLRQVAEQAALAGLALRSRHAMPANNLLLVWARMP